MSWEDFGYRTNKPCDVCGRGGDNQSEPRFGYVVCKEHYHMTPVEVSKAKEERLNNNSELVDIDDLLNVDLALLDDLPVIETDGEETIFHCFTDEEMEILINWSNVAKNQYILSAIEEELYEKLNNKRLNVRK